MRQKLEAALKADFSDVRVFEGLEASAIGARAVTQGNHVHFALGRFKPNDAPGQELLGHELVHVVQQREGRVRPTTIAPGLSINEDPTLEREASLLGKHAARGLSARTGPTIGARPTPHSVPLQMQWEQYLAVLAQSFGVEQTTATVAAAVGVSIVALLGILWSCYRKKVPLKAENIAAEVTAQQGTNNTGQTGLPRASGKASGKKAKLPVAPPQASTSDDDLDDDAFVKAHMKARGISLTSPGPAKPAAIPSAIAVAAPRPRVRDVQQVPSATGAITFDVSNCTENEQPYRNQERYLPNGNYTEFRDNMQGLFRLILKDGSAERWFTTGGTHLAAANFYHWDGHRWWRWDKNAHTDVEY